MKQTVISAGLTFLLSGVQSQEQKPTILGYLAQNRFEMQNSFVTNLLKHIKREDDSDFDFDTKSLSSEAEVESCLDSGECSAILCYNHEEEHNSGRMLAQDSVVDLPILDDPALACTLPQYGQAFVQSLNLFFYWFIGIFFYFIVFAYLFTGCKKYKKPLKSDARS